MPGRAGGSGGITARTAPAPLLSSPPAPVLRLGPVKWGGGNQQNKTKIKGEVVRFGVKLRARPSCETGRHGTDSGPPARLCKARPPRRRGSPAAPADTSGGRAAAPALPALAGTCPAGGIPARREPGATYRCPRCPLPQVSRSAARPPPSPRGCPAEEDGARADTAKRKRNKPQGCPPSAAPGEPLALPPLSWSATTTTNTAERSAACGAGTAPEPPVVGRPRLPLSPPRSRPQRRRRRKKSQ